MLKGFIIVGLGSFIGGGLRYLVSCWTHSCSSPTFPLGTFAVNILGCLMIGILYALFERNYSIEPSMKLFLTVGFCGGFTTFSTFINENVQMLRASQIIPMAIYAGLSFAAGILALCAGNYLVRIISNQ